MDWSKFEVDVREWDTLVKEVGEWSLRNFGEQPSHRQVLGMIEELGELGDAQLAFRNEEDPNSENILDAIGDTLVYMADFCSRTNRSMADIVESAVDTVQHLSKLAIIRRLAHHQLKREQGIRKGEDHEAELTVTLSCLFHHLLDVCERVLGDKNAVDEAIRVTWDKVSKRDWVKNPINGEANA